jgi:hypothetical protein
MKTIFEKWLGERCFSVRSYKKAWRENGNKPRIDFWTNGAKKSNPKDTCLDVTLIIGYTVFNYTNFAFN